MLVSHLIKSFKKTLGKNQNLEGIHMHYLAAAQLLWNCLSPA